MPVTYYESVCWMDLEGEPRAELHFAPWRSRFRDGAELRSIHEPVGRAKVGMVHGVEGLAANLEAYPLSDGELARKCQVHGLHPGTVHRIAAGITERVRRGDRECRGVEPGVGRMRARRVQRLPIVTGADRVLAQDRSEEH